MTKMTLPSQFSWKWGFLDNSAQELFNRNDSKNSMPKRNLKNYGPNMTKMLKQPQWLQDPTNNVYAQEDSMPIPNRASHLLASRRTAYKLSHWEETTLKDNEPAQDHTQHKCHIHHTSPICGLPLEHSPLANQSSTQVRIEPIAFADRNTCITTNSEKKQFNSPKLFKDGGTTYHGAKQALPNQQSSRSEVMQ